MMCTILLLGYNLEQA